jgi:hypothetical protein
MPKFSSILQGAKARRRGEVLALDGQSKIEVDFRILTVRDDAEIERAAVAYARSKGVEVPTPGNSQYERGLALYTVLFACLDYEVTDREERYFASIEEIDGAIDDSRLVTLYFQQRAFQKETSPNPGQADPITYLRLVYESFLATEEGKDPALPFVGLPYGMLVNFAVQSAHQLSRLLQPKSPSGSESPGVLVSSENTAKP